MANWTRSHSDTVGYDETHSLNNLSHRLSVTTNDRISLNNLTHHLTPTVNDAVTLEVTYVIAVHNDAVTYVGCDKPFGSGRFVEVTYIRPKTELVSTNETHRINSKSQRLTVTTSETFTRAVTFNRSHVDNPTADDTVIEVDIADKSKVEALTVADAFTKVAAYHRLKDDTLVATTTPMVFTHGHRDSVNTGDNLTIHIGYATSCGQILLVVDTHLKVATYERIHADDPGPGSCVDDIDLPYHGSKSYTQHDVVTSVADSTSKTHAAVRVIDDTTTTTGGDALTVLFSRQLSTHNDTATVADTTVKSSGYNKTENASVTIADAVALVATYARAEAESVTANDVVSKVSAWDRSEAETLTGSTGDSGSYVATYERYHAETPSAVDIGKSAWSLEYSHADSVLARNIYWWRSCTFARAEAESVNASDSASQPLHIIHRVNADTLTGVADTTSKVSEWARFEKESSLRCRDMTPPTEITVTSHRLHAESLTASDSRSMARNWSFTENESVTATITTTLPFHGSKSFTQHDVTTANDTITKVDSYNKSKAEALAAADSHAKCVTYDRIHADSPSTTDALGTYWGYNLTHTDVSRAFDGYWSGGSRVVWHAHRLHTETPTAADTVIKVVPYVIANADAATVADSGAEISGKSARSDESVTTGDNTFRVVTWVVSHADTVTPSDDSTAADYINVEHADGVNTTDNSVIVSVYSVSQADAATTIDEQSKIVNYVLAPADEVSPTDSHLVEDIKFLVEHSDSVSTTDKLETVLGLKLGVIALLDTNAGVITSIVGIADDTGADYAYPPSGVTLTVTLTDYANRVLGQVRVTEASIRSDNTWQVTFRTDQAYNLFVQVDISGGNYVGTVKRAVVLDNPAIPMAANM